MVSWPPKQEDHVRSTWSKVAYLVVADGNQAKEQLKRVRDQYRQKPEGHIPMTPLETSFTNF